MRMRIVAFTLLALLAGRLAAPSEATAQRHPYGRLTDAIVLGGTFGATGSGATVMGGGPEIGGLIEVPIGDMRLRGEAAVGFWRYNGEAFYNVPGSRMRRHRLSVSVVNARAPLGPNHRVRGYGGGGGGFYFYRFPARPNGGSWGLHGLAGAEYLLPTMRSRWILCSELQVHLHAQPRSAGGGTPLPMLSGHASLLLKYRLP
jgi:hypothetical protein